MVLLRRCSLLSAFQRPPGGRGDDPFLLREIPDRETANCHACPAQPQAAELDCGCGLGRRCGHGVLAGQRNRHRATPGRRRLRCRCRGRLCGCGRRAVERTESAWQRPALRPNHGGPDRVQDANGELRYLGAHNLRLGQPGRSPDRRRSAPISLRPARTALPGSHSVEHRAGRCVPGLGHAGR